MFRFAIANSVVLLALGTADVGAQGVPARSLPIATLTSAPRQSLVQTTEPAVDSNSPVIWELIEGQRLMHVLTSIDGLPRVSAGRRLGLTSTPSTIQWDVWPLGGAWMEAVIRDADGTWYGFYHNEVEPAECGGNGKVHPQIGAARSIDQGRTWTNLGIVLAPPATAIACDTANHYFTGGVGDFTVLLSPDTTDLYFLFSQYTPEVHTQGVAVARLAWADRDAPVGKITVWDGSTWLPVEAQWTHDGAFLGWAHPSGRPLFTTTDSWHDGSTADAFWGPSVHYNSHLQLYVMLLNRTKDPDFGQAGIYVSYAKSLSDPAGWSLPAKLVDGGQWYPQIVGLEPGVGTDKEGGRVVRFFMGGISDHVLSFAY